MHFLNVQGATLVSLAAMNFIIRWPRGTFALSPPFYFHLRSRRLCVSSHSSHVQSLTNALVPPDKFEWGTSITRLTVGFLVISMSALDVGASNALIDSNLRYTGSRIWSLALHSWV